MEQLDGATQAGLWDAEARGQICSENLAPFAHILLSARSKETRVVHAARGSSLMARQQADAFRPLRGAAERAGKTRHVSTEVNRMQ